MQRTIGRVKWFNNKSGFGFITVLGGDTCIFAHYSSLRGESSQYKYLVQGEYVEFVLDKSTNEQHEFQANDITGIREGLLMCDTLSNCEELWRCASAMYGKKKRCYQKNNNNIIKVSKCQML